MPTPAAPRFPFLLALGWTAFITLTLWFALSFVFLSFGRGANDIVLLGATQVVVYAFVLWVFGVASQLGARDLLAVRPTSVGVCIVAAALGAALQIPATLLSNLIEHFFPLPDSVLAERLARITPHSTAHGLAILAVVAGLGPCVEEFFFRGALFGLLRRSYGAAVSIAVVALCFALGHLDARLLLPLFLAACVLGDIRERTGSIWPGFAAHAAFNSVTLATVFSGTVRAGKPPPISLALAVSGCALTLGLLAGLRSLALSSPVAQNARSRDVH